MQPRRGQGAGITLLLALFGFAVAGYHPYAEDGGVYVAGIEKLLRPELFPAWTAFVAEPMRFSLFAPLVAGLVRATHVSLGGLLLALDVAGVWATLFAGWMIAARCAGSPRGRMGAVALLACWLTLPVAGTSLILTDPYVTARTISTPLIVMALAWALDRRRASWLRSGLALAAAAAVHPLMAGYGLAAVLLLLCLGSPHAPVRRWGPWVLGFLALLGASCVQALASAETADYVRVAITRYYWFSVRWHWFEWLGLAGPAAMLLWLRRRQPGPAPAPAQRSSRSAADVLGSSMLALAAIAFVVAVCFARESLATHLVARMQPLRCFQLVYLVMTLLLGAWLGEVVLRGNVWRWATMLLALGGVMSFVQVQTYHHSAHVEWPGRPPENAWERAFVWVRGNTPETAVFALDAHYITEGKREDAQCFRALAERSALPDYSKDGGEASLEPELTPAWAAGQAAQTGLEGASDAERAARLKPLGATWVVLERESATAWDCPHANETVKVCRIP